MHDCSISSALAMDILQSCTKSSISLQVENDYMIRNVTKFQFKYQGLISSFNTKWSTDMKLLMQLDILISSSQFF